MYVNIRPNIKYGIRANPNMDFVMATCTMTKCHNETGNIWTHLLAAMYFIYHLLLLSNPNMTETYKIFKHNDDMVMHLKFAALCPMMCFILSTVYHSYNCINKELTILLYKIDLMGIGIKICGLCSVLVFGLFYSEKLLRNWISVVLFTLFIIQFTIQLAPCYSDSKYDNYKTALYVAMTINNILVCLLWVFIVAKPNELDLVGPYLLFGGLSIIIGFIFFYF
jgi:adiponectin receptor